MEQIILKNINHYYKNHQVLKTINLAIKKGEFFSLLGPSGVGKSTLLNIIAGFLIPSQGEVLINGQDVTLQPPYKRNVGMVFQSYALFPHLSVFDNVAYGLRIRKKKKSFIQEKVMHYLKIVQLDQLIDQMPHQLSGGQQQRVAIARVLAIEPDVLLLDEPLSNLDAKLRKKMQFELRKIQREVGITTILVTHDQDEALSLSDRIALLGNAKIQQVGLPKEIYRHPANKYVANFVGQVNFLSGQRINGGNGYQYEINLEDKEGRKVVVDGENVKKKEKKVHFMIRPERLHLSNQSISGSSSLLGTITALTYLGNAVNGKVSFKEGELLFFGSDSKLLDRLQIGEELYVSWQPADLTSIED